MKRIIYIIGIVLFLGSLIKVSAMAGSGIVYILPNMVWTADYDNTAYRTTNYSYVTARNHAVWPVNGGIDTFKKIHVRVTNGYDLVISGTTVLNETDTQASNIFLYEGYLSTTLVGFEFRGNTSNEAYANVSYSGN